jgi:hypothetical protein
VKTEGAKESEVDADGELLIRLWPILGGFLAVVVWLVRLESSVKMNTKLLNELDIEFKSHRREIWSRVDQLRDLINGKK